ncbi:hypothetical protein ANCDUO_04041 [Ancylostoma duodenale]|uniref:Uncharacterized protein n=1 Tax=Ancylostoma duodenale TaxID=51022 RepID=A0A0C2DS84_9BILA|nr:hypothetical protein ANCDUO_04041 [Ancylostoma duodenale]
MDADVVQDNEAFHRDGKICTDVDALKCVLKFAYHRCIDWTDFIWNSHKINQHTAIEGRYFEGSYNQALQAIRGELEEESASNRPRKSGPIGFIAGECAAALERDGMKGGRHKSRDVVCESRRNTGGAENPQDVGHHLAIGPQNGRRALQETHAHVQKPPRGRRQSRYRVAVDHGEERFTLV